MPGGWAGEAFRGCDQKLEAVREIKGVVKKVNSDRRNFKSHALKTRDSLAIEMKEEGRWDACQGRVTKQTSM